MSVRKIRAIWDGFWFSDGSPVPVALFRVVIGLLALQFFCWIQPQCTTFFGQHAIASPETAATLGGSPRLDVLGLFPADDRWLRAMVGLGMIAAICLAFGLFSRTSAAVVYVILLSLDARNPFVMCSGVRILYIMSLFLACSRCGEAISLDRLGRIWLPDKPELGAARAGSVVAQRLMQLQLAIVYWSAFSGKLHGRAWMEGTAVYLVCHLEDFQKLAIPCVFDHLWCSQLLSWGTLLVEFCLCTLIWVRQFRYPVLVAGLLFHLALEWTLIIPLFQLVMVASYIPFLDADDMRRSMDWIKRLARGAFGPARVVQYDPASRLSVRLAETVRRLDVLGLVQVRESPCADNAVL